MSVRESPCRLGAAGRCKSFVTLPAGCPPGRLRPELGWRRAARPVWVLRPGEASVEERPARGEGAAVPAPVKRFCTALSHNAVLSVQLLEAAESRNEKDLHRARPGCSHNVASVACFRCSVLGAEPLFRVGFLG